MERSLKQYLFQTTTVEPPGLVIVALFDMDALSRLPAHNTPQGLGPEATEVIAEAKRLDLELGMHSFKFYNRN